MDIGFIVLFMSRTKSFQFNGIVDSELSSVVLAIRAAIGL